MRNKKKLRVIIIERIVTKNPFHTIIIRFFDHDHLEIKIEEISQQNFKSFTVKKSTFRMTYPNASGRYFPPDNFRVHVSKLGAWAKSNK